MSLHLWWTFVIATFFISASPGPNMLHMMASGMRHGLKPTYYAMAGCMSAAILLITISVVGVGALLKTSPHIFDILRLIGAAYLIYVGIKTILQPVNISLVSDIEMETQSTTARAHFRGGFLVGSSNPKLLLFATAFFPQFIDKALPETPQFAILLATCFVIELSWFMTYARGGVRIAGYIKQPRVQKLFNRVTGGLFTLFGILLLAAHAA